MSEIKQGAITITLREGMTLPENAGKLSVTEAQRVPKARRGVGATCLATADDIERSGGQISVPDVTPDDLRAAAERADALEPIIADLEYLLQLVRQANMLLDADAHDLLRKVVATVRALEKFDPSAPARVPSLIRYFATR
jgi:hypothetical protein